MHQRYPHLLNALKYALSCVVVLFATFNPSLMAPHQEGVDLAQGWFIFFFLVSSAYTSTWDILQDYALFDWRPRPPPGLLALGGAGRSTTEATAESAEDEPLSQHGGGSPRPYGAGGGGGGGGTEVDIEKVHIWVHEGAQ